MRQTVLRTRRLRLLWTGASGALLVIPLTLSAAGTLPADFSDGAAPTIIPAAGGTEATPVAAPSNPQFQADRYEAEVQRQLYMLYQQPPQSGAQLPSPGSVAGGRPAAPPKPRKMRLKDYFNPTAWKRQYERRQRYNAYLERQQDQQSDSTMPDAELGSAVDMTAGSPAPLAPAVTLPPNSNSGWKPPQPGSPPAAPAAIGAAPATPFGVPGPLPATVSARPQLERVSPDLFGLTAADDTAGSTDDSPTFEMLLPDASAQTAEPQLMPATAATDLSPVEPATPTLLIVPQPVAAEASAAASLSRAPSADLDAQNLFVAPRAGDGFLAESENPFESPRTASAEEADVEPAFQAPLDAESRGTASVAEATNPFTGLELQDNPFVDPPAEAVALRSPLSAPVADAPLATAKPELNAENLPSPMLLAPEADVAAADEAVAEPAVAEPVTRAPAQFATRVPAALPAPDAGASARAAMPATNRTMLPDVQQKLERIAARQGLTGFKGFCPVMLTDYRELVDAKLEHTAEFEGRRYWFSSAAARETFMLDPTAYAPARGGIDVVLFDKSGESREGSLDHAVWYRGHLYLFDSAETRAAFAAAPLEHIVTN